MDLQQLLFATLLFLGASLLFVSFAEKLRLGAIFGYLAAGLAIGPYSPGPVMTTHVDELLDIGEFGVVLLMFTIGLEMQPQRLWEMRKLLLGLGPLQVFVTGAAVGVSLLAVTAFDDGVLTMNAAISLGLGLALSSTAIVAQLLAEKGDVATEHGKAVFAVLIAQDIASVLLLALLPLLAITTEAPASATPIWEQGVLIVSAVAAILVGGRYILPFLFDRTAKRQSAAQLGVILLIAILTAALAADGVGLSMAMGTFLLGVMLSASRYRTQLEADVSWLKGSALGLFFVAVGMSIDIDLVIALGLELVGYAALIVAVKVVVMALLGLAFGLGSSGALKAAFLLAPCSEFGFVLFASAKAIGLISAEVFAIAVATIALSMAITPLTTAFGYRLADRGSRRTPAQGLTGTAGEDLENHVVVAGFNRAGRLMCMMLEKCDTCYIAFDLVVDRVTEGRKDGFNVHYGDITDPRLDGAAAYAKARSVVVTIDDVAAATRLVEALRNFYPQLPIQFAARDLQTQDAMRARGVTDTVCTDVEGNLQLGKIMLSQAGVPEPDVDNLIEVLRDHDYALIRSPGKASASQ